MPPVKRKADKEVDPTLTPARVTRAAAKRSAAGPVSSVAAAVPAEKKTKVAKQPEKKKKKKEEEEEKEKGVVEVSASSKTVIIEHCKQCNSFKTRANHVKEGLEKRASGITVILNPEKPRRGCFEIREEGGKKFISLLDMKRPFTPMKKLDMDKVISDIVDEISTVDG